jgi:hypothetical protein
MVSQAGENSQTNGPEHTIISSILTEMMALIFKEATDEEQYHRTHMEPAKQPIRATSFNILN